MPYKEDRFVIPLIPPLVILSSYFIGNMEIKYKRAILSIIVLILIFSLIINFYINARIYYNVNTNCFGQVIDKLKEINGDFIIVSENSPLFRYYVGQDSIFYPDNLNELTIKELENSANKPIYFVFTRFNSGFQDEKWKNFKKIMEEKYKLIFECQGDKEVNWIYSNT